MTAASSGGPRRLHPVPTQQPLPDDRGAAVLELRRRAATDPDAPNLDTAVRDAHLVMALAAAELDQCTRHIRRLRALIDDIADAARDEVRARNDIRDAKFALAVLELIHPRQGPPGAA